MLDISKVKVGDRIKYIGKSLAYGGGYNVYAAEETYMNPNDCPVEDQGKLMIIELMNDGITPMYFRIDGLEPNEWEMEIEDNELENKVGLDDTDEREKTEIEEYEEMYCEKCGGTACIC